MRVNLPNIEDSKGYVSSIFPCTGYLTFGPWIYMVPQYPPKSVLMLGYAGGTVAGLIRLFYGDVPITGVDISLCEQDFYDIKPIQADARKYIKTCGRFDTVIVDVFEDGELVAPDWVTDEEFANDLKCIADYIILHTTEGMNIDTYKENTRHIKTLALNTSRFDYFMVNEIPQLPIR